MSGGALRVAFAALVTLVALGGCGGDSAEEPPRVRLGDALCEECGMIISDERFATATIVEGPRGPEPRLFDDFNCQFIFEHAHQDLLILARWSHDYRSGGWIRAEKAFFVRSPTLRTPMASNVAAFESEGEARQVALELEGEVLDLEELRATLTAGGGGTP